MRRFLCTSQAPSRFDIVIAGGGLVGAALACSLGRLPVLRDRKIAVLETQKLHQPVQTTPDRYSNRVSAITPGSAALLDEIGVWQDIQQTRLQPFTRMQVWDACSEARISFNCQDIGAIDMGYIVENDVIVAALHRQMKTLTNVEVLEGLQVVDIDKNDKVSEV
jgi:ubiquinone biosynthesis monooxygenase Coq6